MIIRHLIWDDWNIAHIARHGVTKEEVEEVRKARFVVLDAHSGRYLIVGSTLNGRILSIILDPEQADEIYYPVTARPADKKEQAVYNEQKGS